MARLNYSVDISDLKRRSYRTTKLFAIVDEFVNSDSDIAEFVFAENEYSNAKSAYNALGLSIRRRHMGSVKVSIRDGRVFLVKARRQEDG